MDVIEVFRLRVAVRGNSYNVVAHVNESGLPSLHRINGKKPGFYSVEELDLILGEVFDQLEA